MHYNRCLVPGGVCRGVGESVGVYAVREHVKRSGSDLKCGADGDCGAGMG